MAGLMEEGEEIIEEASEKNDIVADLALIAAAQKVEHYEISGDILQIAAKPRRPHKGGDDCWGRRSWRRNERIRS